MRSPLAIVRAWAALSRHVSARHERRGAASLSDLDEVLTDFAPALHLIADLEPRRSCRGWARGPCGDGCAPTAGTSRPCRSVVRTRTGTEPETLLYDLQPGDQRVEVTRPEWEAALPCAQGQPPVPARAPTRPPGALPGTSCTAPNPAGLGSDDRVLSAVADRSSAAGKDTASGGTLSTSTGSSTTAARPGLHSGFRRLGRPDPAL